MSQQFYSSQGRPIVLGRRLGQGGEGAVFEVSGHTGLVAKVYHKPVSVERAAKLNAMVMLKTDRLLNLSAWPIDTLHESSGRAVKGFVMPKVTGHRDIHILYGIKTRHAEYPDARWPFLLQAAANVARAFSVIHEHKHVIGDVNQGGVVVSKTATVRLVDCDSFQITTNGNRYLCEVGVPTHTPPELQGKSFKGVVRTHDHDGFGLAVIIFQLLFLGRHPFSGGFLGGGDMPLEKAILQNRFAYGPGATARRMRQPPATLQLEAVSNPLVNLFERAFLSNGNRPRAHEWIAPLEQLAKGLKQCNQNSGHSYLSTLNSCPWCSIESRSGVVVFFPIYVAGTATTGTFNISAVWAQITSVPAPGPLQSLPVKNSNFVTPSAKATEIRQARRTRSYIGTIALVVASIIVLAIPGSGCTTFFLILVASIVAGAFVRSGEDEDAQKLQQAKFDAEHAWVDIQRRWKAQHMDQRFSAKLKELDAKKTEYQNLASVHQRKLQQLQKEVQQRQLEKFLDGHRIDKARISGIGHARQITLRSYGLETAADITVSAVLAVPGFGQTYATKLLAWRYGIESKFVFDPKRGVDPHDKRNVDMEIQTRRAKLEQDLRSGVVALRQISDQVQSAQSGLRKSSDVAMTNLVQTEVDLAAGSAAATLIPIVVVFVLSIWAIVFFRTGASEPSVPLSYSNNSSVTRPARTAKQPDGPVPLSTAQITAHAESAYDKGVALAKAKKFSEAETAYVQATTLRPEFVEAQHELGYVRFKLKRYDDSLVALFQAYTLRPEHAETSRLLGQVYEAKENWRDAAKYYGEAAALEPKHAQTHFNWSRALKNSGSLHLAIKAMLNAVKLKPEWPAAHYELGSLYIEAGESELAREQYEILISLDQELAEKLAVKLHE